MGVEFGNSTERLQISDLLESQSPMELIASTKLYVKSRSIDEQKALLENDVFIALTGGLIAHADRPVGKQKIARVLTKMFDKSIRLDAYDTYSKAFGLPVSVR